MQSRSHTCIFLHEIPTRGPVCETLRCGHWMEKCVYPTDGTALYQGACWKCGRGRIKQRRIQIQCRYKGIKKWKETLVCRHIPQQGIAVSGIIYCTM